MIESQSPSGCRRCGRPERNHFTWYTATGKHVYEPPTQTQIKARMLSRRASRRAENAAVEANSAVAARLRAAADLLASEDRPPSMSH